MSTNIFAHLNKFLVKLEEFEKEGRAMDTYRWFRYLTFEVVSKYKLCNSAGPSRLTASEYFKLIVVPADIGFGADYDMISTGETEHPFVNDFDDSVSWGVLVSHC